MGAHRAGRARRQRLSDGAWLLWFFLVVLVLWLGGCAGALMIVTNG